MTHLARLSATCLLAFSPLAIPHLLAQEPVVIERAPETPREPSRDDVEGMRAENQRLAADLEAKRHAIERLTADLNSALASRAENETALKASARELATLRAKLARLESAPPPQPDAELQKKLESTQATIDVLVGKNQQLESNLAARTAELREVQAALEKAQKAAPDSAAQLASEKARADEAASRVSTLANDTARLQQENATLQNQINDLRASETKLREQLASAAPAPTAAAPSPDLSAKLADAEAKLAAAQREIERLSTSSADQTRSAAELQSLREQKASLETQLAQAREAQAAAANSAAATPPSPDLAAQLSAAEGKLATVLRSYSLLQAEQEKLKAGAAANEQLQAELETLRKNKADLESRLALAQTPAPAAAEPSPDLERKLAETQDKLTTALRSFSLLQAENDRLKADASQAVQTVEATAAKNSTESAAQMAALFNELRQTKAQLTSLAAENADLKTRLAISGPPPGSTLASPSRPGTVIAALESGSVSSPAAAPAGAPANGRTHVVALGDTLGKISRQYYGTPNRWEEILRANRDVVPNENALPVGVSLRIP